jgi:uncharacterized protein DUF6113
VDSVTASSGRPQEPARSQRWAVAIAYVLLVLFGAVQGVVGSFQYGRGVAHVPVAAVCAALVIGVTSAAGGRGMRSAGGAVAPAAGWLIAAFLLAMPRRSGSVIITNTAAGQVFLYGGALCAAIGVGIGLSAWTRRQVAAPPPGPAALKRHTGA